MICDLEKMPVEMLLGQIGHLYHMKNEQYIQDSGYDIRGGQAGILFILKYKGTEGALSQKELAERLHIKPPSVTAAIKKIENTGLVVREKDEHDKRIMRIRITEEGDAYIENIVKQVKEVEALAMKNISAEEKMLLKRLLLQIRINLVEGMDIGSMFEGMNK